MQIDIADVLFYVCLLRVLLATESRFYVVQGFLIIGSLACISIHWLMGMKACL